MGEPDVSFLIAAYRPRPDWLAQAIESLLSQTGVEAEVVVVDDGSPVPVRELLGKYRREARLRLIRAEHGGLSAARNIGLSEARGRYIRYFDADDVAERGSTERLLRLAGRGGDVAYGATAVCDAELRVRWVMRPRQDGDVEEDGLLDRFPVRAPSLLLPRSLAAAAGPWESGVGGAEDWDYLQRVFERAEVRRDANVAFFYRRHSASVTADFEPALGAAKQVVARYFERHPEHRGTDIERRAEAMLDAHAARVYATRGEPRKAIMPLARALLRHPPAVGDQIRLGMPALRAGARRGVGRFG